MIACVTILWGYGWGEHLGSNEIKGLNALKIFVRLFSGIIIIAAAVRVINLAEGLRIDVRIRTTGQSQRVQLA